MLQKCLEATLAITDRSTYPEYYIHNNNGGYRHGEASVVYRHKEGGKVVHIYSRRRGDKGVHITNGTTQKRCGDGARRGKCQRMQGCQLYRPEHTAKSAVYLPPNGRPNLQTLGLDHIERGRTTIFVYTIRYIIDFNDITELFTSFKVILRQFRSIIYTT